MKSNENKKVMDKLDKLQDHYVRTTKEMVDDILAGWSRFNNQPKLVTVDGRDAVLI